MYPPHLSRQRGDSRLSFLHTLDAVQHLAAHHVGAGRRCEGQPRQQITWETADAVRQQQQRPSVEAALQPWAHDAALRACRRLGVQTASLLQLLQRGVSASDPRLLLHELPTQQTVLLFDNSNSRIF